MIRARAAASPSAVREAVAGRAWLPTEGTWVEPTLTPGPAGTTVVAVEPPPADGEVYGYPAELAAVTYWSLALANLVDQVEGRAPSGRVDLTSADLSTAVVIAAPTDEVFESLIDPELFERWFGLPFAIELYEGGTWSIGGGGPTGTVTELVADRRLSLAEVTGVMEWRLSEVDEGTRLAAAFRGAGEVPPYPGWMGWLSAISQLRRLHEVPERCPIWVNQREPDGVSGA